MTKKRQPKSPIFSKGDDNTFADMVVARGREHVYAEGYLYAGDLLASHVATTGYDHNLLIYPIALLYRHHIELELKNIINTGGSLVDKKRNTVTHNLDMLWKWAKPIIRTASATSDPPEFAEMDKVVSDFTQIDVNGDAFRFPNRTTGDKTLDGLEHMNIGQLSQTLHRLGRFLGGCWEVVNERVEFDNGENW